MYKTSSINWNAVSFLLLCWIEAAFLIDKELLYTNRKELYKLSADLRVLLKDIDDVQRIKLTGKKNSIINWNDLPSQAENRDKNNVEIRKEFLKNLSDRFNNK